MLGPIFILINEVFNVIFIREGLGESGIEHFLGVTREGQTLWNSGLTGLVVSHSQLCSGSDAIHHNSAIVVDCLELFDILECFPLEQILTQLGQPEELLLPFV